MRIEFNGLILEGNAEELGITKGFTLTVEGRSMSLSLSTDQPGDQGVHAYRLHFRIWPQGGIPGVSLNGKIPTIKLLREQLAIGLGEAKGLVEGTDVVIIGSNWNTSQCRKVLNDLLRDHGVDVQGAYTVTACPLPDSASRVITARFS